MLRNVGTFGVVIAVFAFGLGAMESASGQEGGGPKAISLTVYSAPSGGGGAYGYGYDPYYYGYDAYYGGSPFGMATGYAIVRETRRIDLAAGENEIRFSDVPQQIDATTVSFKSLLDPKGTYVLEQNFEYDLISADKVLDRYIGKDVALHQKGDTSLTGQLLSFDGASFVLQTPSATAPIQIVSRGELVERISFAELPGGLITKPTLMWRLNAKKAGTHDVEVTYQTNGMSWSADYNLVLNANDTAANLSAWVTLINQSGAEYRDANLKLVAGDVQRVTPVLGGAGYGAFDTRMAGDADGRFSEKDFFEYHLYTLGRPTSVANNATKQIELFTPAMGIAVNKSYQFRGNSMNFYDYGYAYTDPYYGTPNKKVDVFIGLENSSRAGLGLPLPAGRVRVYKTDEADGGVEFVGEDRIDHTARNESLRVKVGSAFDIVGEWKVSDFKVDYNAKWMEESFEVVLRNHKKEDIVVQVREPLYRWLNWTITASSQDFVKEDARNIRFDVKVAKEGTTTLTYTARYTW